MLIGAKNKENPLPLMSRGTQTDKFDESFTTDV
jgi:hypothetical protein